MKKNNIALIIFFILAFFTFAFAGEGVVNKKNIWPFEGIFGSVDKEAAQRGFQVYKEVCSSCHSLNHLRYDNLVEIGFSEEEIKYLASQYTVQDGPNDQGQMFERARLPRDKFMPPYKNENEARYSNNGAMPPDLSLIIKARHDGANYVYSLLTGYKEAPKNFKLNDGLHYNEYFPGHQIAMPSPLSDGLVQYQNLGPASVEQMARDVVIFLQWASEPEMEARKSLGLKAMLFLICFTVLFYFVKRRIWSSIE